jgi:DNA-binding HxlR family transcriptional regulator
MKLKAVECEVERLLAVIAGKWKVLLLRELFPGARRHA